MLGRLWSRVKALFFRLFRRRPEPGRFETDSQSSVRGWLAGSPWIWPQRDYLLYLPQGYMGSPAAPLLVLIHGCRQTPEEIAAATRITALADTLGCFVLMPRQSRRANAWGCWNWFDTATASGWGESAIVAAQIDAVHRKYRIDGRRVFVAGMSAGGGLASAVALRRPELVAGAFVHSGIACGVASGAQAAFDVMKRGAEDDNFKEIAREIRARTKAESLPVALVAIQGGDDSVVAPVNACQLVRQFLILNGHPGADAGADSELPPPDRSEATLVSEARTITTSEWLIDGQPVVRHVLVGGLGHAWSGGDDSHPYNDPRPPDATALLAAFVRGELTSRT